MKVLLINGSPHREGCTHTALAEVAAELEKQGVETREFWIGPAPAGGCLGCGGCARTGRCVQKDKVNEALELLPDIDGLIVGSPVHYAAASGSVTGFLDRLFYAGGAALRYKPGAAVVSARRAGTTAALALEMYLAGARDGGRVHHAFVTGELPGREIQERKGEKWDDATDA